MVFLLKNRKRIPGMLIAVIGATTIVDVLDLAARADVSVLGPLPKGLLTLAIPWITYSDIVPVMTGGCAIALVSFADTSVLSPRLRRANRAECRSKSGDGGARGSKSGCGFLSGLSDQ